MVYLFFSIHIIDKLSPVKNNNFVLELFSDCDQCYEYISCQLTPSTTVSGRHPNADTRAKSAREWGVCIFRGALNAALWEGLGVSSFSLGAHPDYSCSKEKTEETRSSPLFEDPRRERRVKAHSYVFSALILRPQKRFHT